MADYWIKLYHEILDDPKMATLPDHLWRRVVELFLCAGRVNQDGHLPAAKQLAWMLRVPIDDLLQDLKEIADTGIIQKTNNGWLVCKFSRRQQAASGAERVKSYRERKQKEQYYGNDDSNEDVTNGYIEQNRTDQNRTDIEEEGENPAQNIFTLYEQNIGMLTPIIAEKLKGAESDYPAEWIAEALKIAVQNNARNWAYAQAILDRWKVDGYKADTRPKKNGKAPAVNEPAGYAGIRAAMEELNRDNSS